MAGLEGSFTIWCHEKDYHTGMPDIGLLFASYLKYLENDSEFWTLLKFQETRVKSIILFTKLI